MTTKEIVDLLKSYDLPFEFSHFSKPMQPPFMIYTIPKTDNFNADNVVYYQVNELEIELYSRECLKEEYNLEKFMTENKIRWDKTSQNWIDEEKVYMTSYILNG